LPSTARWANIGGESSDWDIIEYLLPETDPEYSERHALSQALKRWEQDVVSNHSGFHHIIRKILINDIVDSNHRRKQIG
jgi:hypothetical protein